MYKKEVRERRGGKAVTRRLLLLPKGLGLFKLAIGLVVIASVLFLVPGLKLLLPGLEKMGTTQSQAMPSTREPVEKVLPPQPEKSPASDIEKSVGLLKFGSDELSLIGNLGSSEAIGPVGTAQGSQEFLDIDVSDRLLSAPLDALEETGAYEEPTVIGLERNY